MESFRALGQELSNWGRWGDDDQRGTLNHITPERLVHAASLVKRGVTFEMSLALNRNGPQIGGLRTNPVHLMSVTHGHEHGLDGQDGAMQFSDDYVMMPLQAGTQWDGLAHVFYDDVLYNNVPATAIGADGAERNSIDAIAEQGVIGRGVLLDVARSRGVRWMEAGDAIGADELQAVADAQGVEILPGDILLVRTGWMTKLVVERSRRTIHAAEPGLDATCARWLHEHDIAAVAMDNHSIEALPNQHPGTSFPLHCVLIRDMGMTLGEWFILDALAEDCAEDGCWEFLFCAPPLKITGAVGSPISPLAVK
jgi:kynurenine formamidase